MVSIQLAEVMRLIHGDTWVEHRRILLITHEKNLTMEIEQAIENIIDIALALQCSTVLRVEEVLLYLALGVKVLREVVDIAVVGEEEVLLHKLGIIAKDFAEEVSTEVRTSEAVLIELHTHVPKVLERIRHSRREVSAKSPNIRLAHLPDTEEAKDMVDTIGIEVIRHLSETELPPVVVVLRHDIPVVGWEAPVLATCIEVIGWCTRRSREVEELWVGGSIHRIRRDTDRDIALDSHSYGVRIIHSIAELLVGVELEVVTAPMKNSCAAWE